MRFTPHRINLEMIIWKWGSIMFFGLSSKVINATFHFYICCPNIKYRYLIWELFCGVSFIHKQFIIDGEDHRSSVDLGSLWINAGINITVETITNRQMHWPRKILVHFNLRIIIYHFIQEKVLWKILYH